MSRLFPALLALALTAAGGAVAQQADAPNATRTPIGDWTKVCPEGGTCFIEQVARSGDGKDLLLFQIQKLPTPQEVKGGKVEAMANILVPLGVFLPGGLRLKIDQGEQTTAPYAVCQPGACVVQSAVDTGLLDRFRKGAKAQLVYVVLENGKPRDVVADVSLSGFTRALNEL